MVYKDLLATINNAAIKTTDTVDLPSNKDFYLVDLDSRIIHGPATISVEGDHFADTIYFLVDRYYDHMDLAQTNCVVEYQIGDQGFVYAVPFCDVRSYDGKIIIPWSISMSATQLAGSVTYALRFFLIDKSEYTQDLLEAEGYPLEVDEYAPAEYVYSLSTRPATTRVLTSLSVSDFSEENTALNLPTYYEQLIADFVSIANASTVFWTDV